MPMPLIKKSLKPLETILFSEIAMVFFMALGILPQEFAYLILLLLGASLIKLNMPDSLKLFILSIPFFVALPANALSDSMSIWRVLIVELFLKVVYEKHCMGRLHSPEKPWSRCAKWCNKFWLALRFHGSKAAMEPANSGYIQKILKQVQNDSCHKLFLLTALFLSIAVLSLLFAQDITAGIKKILFLINIFLLFPIVIYSAKSENDLAGIMKSVFCSSAAVIFIGYFQFGLTFFVPLYNFWQFWAGSAIKAFYGQNLSDLLSYSNTWFSYYETLPPTLRMFSVMPDSHSFAMFVLVSMPIVLSLIFYCKGAEKKILSASLILFLLAVFFSGSRGAWAGSIFALPAAIYLFISREPKNAKSYFSRSDIMARAQGNLASGIGQCRLWLREKLRFFGDKLKIGNKDRTSAKLIICSVVLFFVLMPVSSFILRQNQEIQLFQSGLELSDKEKSAILERAISISDFSEMSNKGRLQIWQETLISIGARPFWGVGFGNFPVILGESSSVSKKGSSAHNIYLDTAAETGIFGLMVFLFLLIEILQTAYVLFFKLKTKYLKIFAGSFFVYFVWICAYGFFDVVIFNDKVLMVAVIAIGILYSLDRATCYTVI